MPRDSTPTPSIRRSARVQDRNQEMIAVQPATRPKVRVTQKHPTRRVDSISDDSRPASPTSDGEQGEGPGDLAKQSAEWSAANDPTPGETDSAKVSQPIHGLVHGSLKVAWAINKSLPMCVIFDAISPVRRFKYGMLYTDSDEVGFPEYDASESGNVTEIDGPPPGWMPYLHKTYR